MEYRKYGFSKTALYAGGIPFAISWLIAIFTNDYAPVWFTVFLVLFYVMVFFIADLGIEMIFNIKEKE